MTRTKIAVLAAALGSTAVLAGCATPPPEGGVRIDQQNYERPALNSVRVLDGTLAQYRGTKNKVDSLLDVEGVYVTKGPTGFSGITAQIRNKTNVMLPLEVRVSWYDQNGVPTDGAQSWTRLFAQPQAMVTFQQSSARMNSVQYYVEIRGAQ